MRVLADYHHHDLWESLELLAERLGWTLLRPIGMDWFDEGYWNHERKWHGDAIARQYLEPWGSDLDGQRYDVSHGRWQTLVTLEQARALAPDVVISTLAHNHEGMARFASEVGATFGLQIGNVRFSHIDMAEDRWDLAAFGLVSGFLPVEPPKPHVVYHQEFSLDDFAPAPPPRGDRLRVASFVQCYPESPTYPAWCETAPAVPEFDWRVYGAYGGAPIDEWAAGNLDRCADVAAAMRASDVAWHAKAWSDGYGHVLHNWHAVGRPMLGIWDYYRDQMGGALLVEGETFWDIGHRTRDEVVTLLRRFAQDGDFHRRACEASAARFREVVNFDEEEQAIRSLFAQVLP